MKINLPLYLDNISASNLSRKLEQYINEREVGINFTTLSFSTPSGLLLLGSYINQTNTKREQKGLDKINVEFDGNKDSNSYLMNCGFFQFCGYQYGKKVNSNPSRSNSGYIPIQVITRDRLNSKKIIIQEAIDEYCNELVKVIYPSESDDMTVYMLAWCLREIMRNVFEHAETEECIFMAQRWPRNGYAEIILYDAGIGICSSLAKSHPIESRRSGLRLAIQPGVTGNKYNVRNDEWQNSGFGLYVLSQFGSMYGDFSLMSDNLMLQQSFETGLRKWFITPIKGTGVKIKVQTKDADYFSNILQKIVREGEEEASGYNNRVKIASKVTKGGLF